MEEHPEPRIGEWYKNLEDERIFEVVAIDENESTIEIQYFESEIGEIDLDSWYEIPIENIAEPEDWSGPFDDLESDDLGDTEVVRHNHDWDNNIDEYE